MPTPRSLNTRHGLSVGIKSVVDTSGTLTDVGVLSSLLTTNKTDIVSAVNEVKGNFTDITTADVEENQNYLYFTQSRARQSVSVTDTGGDGSLAYDNTTGIFTYTGPSATEVWAHFSGGTGVTITNGIVAIGQAVNTNSDVAFNNTTLTGVLYGPSQFVIDPSSHGDITGELIVLGNLIVEGTTTTINSTAVEVEDKTLVLSKSSTLPVEANNSGIVINGANANILYAFTTDSWNANKTLKGVDGDASSPTYSFATDPGLGLYRSANDQLSLAINGLERFRLNNTLMTLVSNTDLVFNRGTFGGTVTTTTLTDNRTYTLPNVNGTIVTTGDTGTVTSTMIADGTIVDGDISATAEIAVSKLADGAARQLLQTDATGVGVEWTSNVDIPGTLDVTGKSNFDTLVSIGVAEPASVRDIGWSTDKGTYSVLLDNSVLHNIGSDQTTLCRNNSNTVPIPKGIAVMFVGSVANSGRIKVAPMVANGTYPGYVFFGVTESVIPAGGDGYVKSFGEIKGINTNSYLEGDILWCDPATPGAFTKVEPLAPNLKLPVAAVLSVGNNGIIVVRWDTGRRLSDLHDVEANGTTVNGDLLVYNFAASRWENGTVVPSLNITENLIVNSINVVESARDVEESRLIRKFGTVSIGVPGSVPFGVGPVIPPGMSLIGIGPDSYNIIDVYSGSLC